MGFAVVLGTITGVGEVVAIASGTWHAMAVTNGGTLMGWGRRSLARDRGALIG
jgi:alpha-tubulin suppressor-like RCC1 family protein